MLLESLLGRAARLWPEVDAVRENAHAPGSRSVTYAALAAETAVWTRRLAGLGVQPGERVAVCSRNRIDFVALYFASARLGAVLVANNRRLLPAEIVADLTDAEAVVVLAESRNAAGLDACRGDAPRVRHWIDLDGATPGWRVPGELPEADPAPRTASEDEVVVQLYTSGTTGRAKGAMLTHRNFCHMVLAFSIDVPLHARSRFFLAAPLFHVGGIMMILLSFTNGATVLLEPEFQPAEAIRRVREDRATHALLVPAMIRWMLLEPSMRGATFPDLGLVLYGAAPMPADQLREALAAFQCEFIQGYGLTETAGVLTVLRPSDHDRALAGEPRLLESAGRAMAGCEARIAAPDGRPLPDGEIGEILVRGPNVFVGYWKRPEDTAAALRDGWLWTGDVGHMDREGFVTVVDRSKDMILVGGENVYPSEVEAVVREVPGVQEAAVIGIPHPTWGEEVLAVVVADPDAAADPAALSRRVVQTCRKRLAQFKCPTRVTAVAELPRTPSNKVSKAQLRAPYWADRSRQV